MLRGLFVINILLQFSFTQEDLHLQLISQLLRENNVSCLDRAYFKKVGYYNSYEEYSLLFEQDLLDPIKTFNLDSIFSQDQRREFNSRLKLEISEIQEKEIHIYLSKQSQAFCEGKGLKISYPIVQKGTGEKFYGIIFENSLSFESGGIKIKLYRKEKEKWILIHESLMAIG